tara:strand:- start:4235 stop:4684 length:450 start_codon:yes stop_codon:yes gene_type:complete
MKKIILRPLIFLIIISCTLESKFGLPNDENINPELIGIWFDGKNHNEYVKIEKSGEKRYKLSLNDSTELVSYSSKVKGFTILNVITNYKGKNTNSFYGIEFKKDTLKFSEVNNNLRKTDFNSQSELIDFFNENINNQEFFINPVNLIRK